MRYLSIPLKKLEFRLFKAGYSGLKKKQSSQILKIFSHIMIENPLCKPYNKSTITNQRR